MADSFKERATPLLERGFSVIPLMPREKKPVAGMGVTKKSRNQDVIDTWAAQWPEANVAVCADDTFLILDADDAAEMEKITGHLNTYTVQSSPGKAHYYFKREPDGFDYVRNLEMGKVGSLRAKNQYVVAAGSIHPKTGQPYKVINNAPVAILDAGLYHKLELVAADAEREIEKIRANWDGKTKIAAGMRQYFLTSQAGKLHDGIRSEEMILAQLLELNARFCDPPKLPSEISRLAAWVMGKKPNKPAVEIIFGKPKIQRGGYVREPIGAWDKWFPLGQVSQIYGASGAGKSTLTLQMLEQVVQGGEFLCHSTPARAVLIVPADRDEEAFRETLKRMGIPRDLFPLASLSEDAEIDAKLAAAELNQLIERHGQPEVVLFEAMDAPCLDETKKGITPYLKSFQNVLPAEREAGRGGPIGVLLSHFERGERVQTLSRQKDRACKYLIYLLPAWIYNSKYTL
jgi:hypothetical protein